MIVDVYVYLRVCVRVSVYEYVCVRMFGGGFNIWWWGFWFLGL